MNLDGIGGALGLGARRVAKAMALDISRVLGNPTVIVALGDPLAKALAAAGLPVVSVHESPRRRKKGPPQIAASMIALPFARGPHASIDALCAAGIPTDGLATLREWARVVRPGGLVTVATAASALVRKVAPAEVMAALMLHALLVDVEQSEIGSSLITSARVPHFAAAIA